MFNSDQYQQVAEEAARLAEAASNHRDQKIEQAKQNRGPRSNPAADLRSGKSGQRKDAANAREDNARARLRSSS
jgi:hypothetical protein